MITVNQAGDFSKTVKFLKFIGALNIDSLLRSYGQKGVDALQRSTPVDSGETSSSWGYTITKKNKSITITWTNDHIHDGVPIAVLIQYGHSTGNGGYVRGIDYINPALKSIFKQIADDVWKGVQNA